MVCFDEHFVQFDAIVQHPATGDDLKRFVVFHESGDEVARFVLLANSELTRWEIQSAAKEALKLFRRRNRKPVRFQLQS